MSNSLIISKVTRTIILWWAREFGKVLSALSRPRSPCACAVLYRKLLYNSEQADICDAGKWLWSTIVYTCVLVRLHQVVQLSDVPWGRTLQNASTFRTSTRTRLGPCAPVPPCVFLFSVFALPPS